MSALPSQSRYIIGTEACERFSFYGMNLGEAANGLPLANIWFPLLLSAVLAVGVGFIINITQKFK